MDNESLTLSYLDMKAINYSAVEVGMYFGWIPQLLSKSFPQCETKIIALLHNIKIYVII